MSPVEKPSNDVEMKNVENNEVDEGGGGDNKVVNVDVLTIEDIREHVRQIEKAVLNKEPRFVLRVLRALPTTRRKMNSNVLHKVVMWFYTQSAKDKDALASFIGEPMDVDGTPIGRSRTGKGTSGPMLPEVDCYLTLLILLRLIDEGKNAQAVECSELVMNKLCSYNRRSLDLIAANCYYFYSRSYELCGQLGKIRAKLHSRLRTATLRSDYEGQAVLINSLLRNYLHYNLYEQADKLICKSTFPETASNNEWARFLYYMGRIKAIQLDYSSARKHLVQALRKAPQHSAVGFKQTVNKLAITVELLLGDIPERQIFRQVTLRKPLNPYFLLTQAVRMGNLHGFGEVLNTHGESFKKDHTYTLILRLRHNVIKTALRAISLSYSRISLADVSKKLTLDSPLDAEFIVGKAIRDGVIEAILEHQQGSMCSKASADLYSTREPQLAFHQRISFCLDIHNQSVKAMRYPPKSYHGDLESAEERREREQQDLELAKEMAEDDDEPFL